MVVSKQSSAGIQWSIVAVLRSHPPFPKSYGRVILKSLVKLRAGGGGGAIGARMAQGGANFSKGVLTGKGQSHCYHNNRGIATVAITTVSIATVAVTTVAVATVVIATAAITTVVIANVAIATIAIESTVIATVDITIVAIATVSIATVVIKTVPYHLLP